VTLTNAAKEQWRTYAADLAPTTAEESARVVANIREVLRRQEWRVVLTFLAMAGEVDLGPLSETRDLELVVTRTPPQGPLTLHPLDGPMERHPFGYMQPRAEAPLVDQGDIEVALVPGLLFARDGGRLGHGRGYYDRLLASFHPRPFLIGVTVDRRVVPELPMVEHDIWMDAVATETGFTEAPG
jgi:5-formyltetrahydrofolate cyclo-ligase